MRMRSKQIVRLCLAQLLHQLYELFKVVLCLRKFLQTASQLKLLKTTLTWKLNKVKDEIITFPSPLLRTAVLGTYLFLSKPQPKPVQIIGPSRLFLISRPILSLLI